MLTAVDRFDADEVRTRGRVVLGVPDFERYCTRESAAMTAVLEVDDAYGWRCAGLTAQLWGRRRVDPHDVCRWQYGENATAVVVDSNSSRGWVCTG